MNDERQSLPGAMFNRLVGSVVSPVVDSVDVDQVIGQIDPDRLLDRVDPNRLLDRVDPNRLLDRVDPNRLLDRVDPDRLLDRVDPDRLLDRLDVDRLIGRIDLNALVQRVDLDAIIDTVDLDRAIGRVDLDAAVDRVDLNRALDRVDLNALVERTELGSIIARSTSGVFGQVLDVARTQMMGVDQVVQAAPARLLRRARNEVPPAPAGAAIPVEETSGSTLKSGERAVAFQGRCAGSMSRFLAFIVDQFIIGALFAVAALLISAAFTVVIGADLVLSEDRLLIVVAYGIWALVYIAGSLAATGRTVGKAIVGVLVVDTVGVRVSGKAALLRTLAFPISFLVFGVGLLLGLFRQDRRELHDLIAATAVVYDWDAGIAERRVTTT